jgi:hypothetical protein
MARGWESKSVEDQQAESNFLPGAPRPRLSAEQLSQQRLRESVLLKRTRVQQQLQASENPKHRQMLERALSDLETQLASLK